MNSPAVRTTSLASAGASPADSFSKRSTSSSRPDRKATSSSASYCSRMADTIPACAADSSSAARRQTRSHERCLGPLPAAPHRRRRRDRGCAARPVERCATVPVTALRVLAVLAGVGVFVVAGGWLLQDWLIYLPSGTPGSPAEAGLPDAEELTVPTEDGLARAAWFVPAAAHTPAGAVLVPATPATGHCGLRWLSASPAQV